jgi:haloacetate dehalogenase
MDVGSPHQNLQMFKTFQIRDFHLSAGRIRGRVGGRGAPLVLLHGHPQNHALWHHVADALATCFRVVMLDLRGYGDSFRPPADAQHLNHSKRAMARDVVEVMNQLGHSRFQVCAHDRGARVAHRLAMDHPQAVERLMLLDIAPSLAMYRDTSEAFAKAYWHWFFLIQPSPLPERLIEADPVAYLRDLMLRRTGPSVFSNEAWSEYERCARIPGTATSMCEDYRAAATIDLDHDRADRTADRRVSQPLRVLWGGEGTVAKCFDVLALWREVADKVDGRPLDCGHYIAEERPEELLTEILKFFKPDESLTHG